MILGADELLDGLHVLTEVNVIWLPKCLLAKVKQFYSFRSGHNVLGNVQVGDSVVLVELQVEHHVIFEHRRHVMHTERIHELHHGQGLEVGEDRVSQTDDVLEHVVQRLFCNQVVWLAPAVVLSDHVVQELNLVDVELQDLAGVHRGIEDQVHAGQVLPGSHFSVVVVFLVDGPGHQGVHIDDDLVVFFSEVDGRHVQWLPKEGHIPVVVHLQGSWGKQLHVLSVDGEGGPVERHLIVEW